MIWIAAKEQNRKIKTKIFFVYSKYENISKQSTRTDKTIDTQQPEFALRDENKPKDRQTNRIQNKIELRIILSEQSEEKEKSQNLMQTKRRKQNKKKRTMNDKYSQSYKKLKTKIEAFYRIQFLKAKKG